MFNLLVKGGGWDPRADWLPSERVFEHTASSLVEEFKPDGDLMRSRLQALPTLFVPEVARNTEQYGRIGSILGFRDSRNQLGLDYAFDIAIDPVPMSEVQRLSSELDISRLELNRTHWAIKDVDLFHVLALDSPITPGEAASRSRDALSDLSRAGSQGQAFDSLAGSVSPSQAHRLADAGVALKALLEEIVDTVEQEELSPEGTAFLWTLHELAGRIQRRVEAAMRTQAWPAGTDDLVGTFSSAGIRLQRNANLQLAQIGVGIANLVATILRPTPLGVAITRSPRRPRAAFLVTTQACVRGSSSASSASGRPRPN